MRHLRTVPASANILKEERHVSQFQFSFALFRRDLSRHSVYRFNINPVTLFWIYSWHCSRPYAVFKICALQDHFRLLG
jgi:hypothetical protein